MNAKKLTRHLIAFIVTHLIPFSILNNIRHKVLESKSSSNILSPVLSIARFRPIPPQIRSFPILDKPHIFLNNDASYISRNIFWLGSKGWENFESQVHEKICTHSSKTIEIGANIGFFTVLGASANPKNEYIAIEPHPVTFQNLINNLSLNKIENVNALQAAASTSTNNKLKLHLPSNEKEPNPTGAYLTGAENIDRASDKFVLVDTINLNEIIHDTDYIKLDIEGSEREVLSGIEEYIITHRPTILVELRSNTPELRKFLTQICKDRYLAFGFDFGKLKKIPLEDIASIKLLPTFSSRDIILVSPDNEFILKNFLPSF